jgi:hypothetical protein
MAQRHPDRHAAGNKPYRNHKHEIHDVFLGSPKTACPVADGANATVAGN